VIEQLKQILTGKLMYSFQLLKTRMREDNTLARRAQIVSIDCTTGHDCTFKIPQSVLQELSARGLLMHDESLIVDPSDVNQTKTVIIIYEDKQFNS
jgi:hypothetical protein